MTKQTEIDYFENMTEEARRFVCNKPFSVNRPGIYLIDIGQIFSLLPPAPSRLLDLGCGSGWTTAMFAKAGYDALGIDLAPSAIQLAKETFGQTGAKFEVHDFETLPFNDIYNIVVIYDCLHHAENELAVLHSVFRALKKGGEIIIVEPGQGHHDSKVAKWAMQTHGVTEKDMPPKMTVHLLRTAGFSEIRVFPRAQFQMMERTGTGRLVKLLSPLLGRRLAALIKTMKNSVFTGRNGVVSAKKPLEGNGKL